jgi:hypothetical protein
MAMASMENISTGLAFQSFEGYDTRSRKSLKCALARRG